MNRVRRTILLMLGDAVLVNAAVFLALRLRFEGDVPAQYISAFLKLAPVFTILRLACFHVFGLYNKIWQYASIGELMSILGAVTAGTVVNIAYALLVTPGHTLTLPRSVFALSWMLNVILIGGSRLAWRLFRDEALTIRLGRKGKRVLIVGAGSGGAAVARELKNHNGHKSLPVGFVDDDATKLKLEMFGLPVLGRRKDIPRLVQEFDIEEIIIAIPSAPGRVIREIVDICRTTTVALKIVPGIFELINGSVSVNQIREVQVEDLLGREPVKVDLKAMAGYLRDRVVLVTGAGGSIGSELCRQVTPFKPKQLLLLGHGENSIYEINQELHRGNSDLEVIPIIVDVKDAAAIERVFVQYHPQVIFHAAAHKHVPLMEDNAAEALKNNIFGTWCISRAAHRHHAENFILISTDKAVNPSSVMGATKRVAEMVIQQVACTSKTKFAAVRFGNVLGSRGSVVPLFRGQIARGGPVTVTHPEMTRFFMTIPEAVQLVIQAGALASGGEVFILDMGEPVKIEDLARSMIRLSGFEPGEDIEIVYTSIRPGEKLFEEILTSEEGVTATHHQRIFVAKPNEINGSALEQCIHTISRSGWTASPEEVVSLLRTVIPGFRVDKLAAGQGAETDAVEQVGLAGSARTKRMEKVPGLARSG